MTRVPVPEPDTTTQATAFDIGLWVAERKTQIAQDWIQRARNEAAAVHPDDHDTGDLVAQAKRQAAQTYIDRAVPPG